MKKLMLILVLALQLVPARALVALDRYKLLDLRIGEQKIQGRVLTHNDEMCWMLHRDGRLQQVTMSNVSDFKEVNQRFQANSRLEIQKQLESEFGKAFEVRTTTHYVVVARHGVAESYAIFFERIYSELMRLFRARGLQVEEPEFPLIAVVLPDQASFINYFREEKTHIQPGVLGYYLSTSNRVAMYERSNAANMDTTVIHEATHQVAFNTGVHSRVARHPRWIVEGLAMVFEADGVRSRIGTSSPAERVNRERFLWFLEYANTRRSPHALKEFVREDGLFEKSMLDAYSEAWALSFFLLETQPREYSNYLKKLVDRDPLNSYDAESRWKDFTESFGEDTDRIESAYLWFIRKIARR